MTRRTRTVAAAAVLTAALPAASAFPSPRGVLRWEPRPAGGVRLGVSLEGAVDVADNPPRNGTRDASAELGAVSSRVAVPRVPPPANSQVPPPAADPPGEAGGTDGPSDAAGRLGEFLDDPAFLDPVDVLDATIGLPLLEGPEGAGGECESVDGGSESGDGDEGDGPAGFIITASTAAGAQPQFPQVPPEEDPPADTSSDSSAPLVRVGPAASSREEDIELTVRAIMGHVAEGDGDPTGGDLMDLVADDDEVDEENEEERADGSEVVEAFLNGPPAAAEAAPPEARSDEPLRRMDEILQQAELISEGLEGAVSGEEEAAAMLREAEALGREAGELLRRVEEADGERVVEEEVEPAPDLDDGGLGDDLAEGSRLIEDELRLVPPAGRTEPGGEPALPDAAAAEEARHAEAERIRAALRIESAGPPRPAAAAPDGNRGLLANTPTVLRILQYTVPAIGIWLCGPVLSMIDTAAVGLLSGTAQQAALNPAVSVTDYGALVVAFMYTATTNLVAAAVQGDDGDPDSGAGRPRTTSTLVTALRLAAAVGVAFGLAIHALSYPLLRLLIGNDAIDPEVLGAALRYVRVRALGMPAAVTIGTAQSASLGMRDVRSPLYVLGAAALVNLLGDVALVPRASRWFGGAAGAAWATVASQYAALVFFAAWMTAGAGTGAAGAGAAAGDGTVPGAAEADGDGGGTPAQEPPRVVNLTRGIMELTGSSSAGRSRRREFSRVLSSTKLAQTFMSDGTSGPGGAVRRKRPRADPPRTRGFLSGGKVSLRSFLSPSTLDASKAREFLPFIVPVTTTSVGRISGYIAMSHVASSTLGTHDMAAHQIIFSIFCCLTPIVDALSQVAQSFVPAVFESRRRDRDRADALRRTVGNFRRVGVVFGGLLVSLVACIPLISRYFTTDPMVLSRVRGALPGVGMFLVVNGLMCAGEGALLGQKDLKFLRNMYAIFFFTVPAYMLRLKNRARLGVQAVGIGTMWAAFSAYNLIRTSIWHLRLAQLQRRTDREVVESDEGYDSLQ